MPTSKAEKARRRARKEALPKYCTVAELASMTGLKEEWIREQIRRGELEAVKIGMRWLISLEALRERGFRI